FRNYYRADADNTPPLNAMVDKADTLGLTIPEMTVLLGGLRTLDINSGHSANGVLTKTPGVLTQDFFTNVLTMDTRWQKVAGQEDLYEGFDRATG
ncbi:MAG: catalase-peroxidase, partial [Bombella apis]|nr:catalase-peroxidase [Bombella apis]